MMECVICLVEVGLVNRDLRPHGSLSILRWFLSFVVLFQVYGCSFCFRVPINYIYGQVTSWALIYPLDV